MIGLTAVQFYVIFTALFIVLYWMLPYKNRWIPLVLLTVAFAWLAYNMVPYDTDDVVNYMGLMDQCRTGGWDAMKYHIEEDHFDFKNFRVPAYYLYYLSKISKNDGILPATTIFIVYALGFSTLYKASKKFEIDKKHFFFGVMFFISTYWYYDVASGTRNGLAFTISFACAYQFLVENKHKLLCIAGFILATFTHSTGLLPVLVAVIALITLNASGKFVNFLLYFGLLAGGSIIRALATVTDNGFVQSIAEKASRHGVKEFIKSAGTSFNVNVSLLALLLILILYVSYYFLNNPDYKNQLKKLYKYSSLMLFFTFGCITSGLIFMRLVRWILPMVGAMLFMIGMQLQKNQENRDSSAYLNYYAPTVEMMRYKLRSVVFIVFAVYTVVHYWYSVNGSSLIWLHFASEIQ